MTSQKGSDLTLLQSLGRRLSGIVEAAMPSPFLFAILLTYFVYLLGILVEGNGPFQMIEFWYGGFWSLLSFGMQMVLILVTGYALAYHPAVQRGLHQITEMPRNGRQAVLMVGGLSMVLGWIHWGLALIAGAILAREMGRRCSERGILTHYPLLCVAGYMGLGLTWHWGLSGSAPLLMNTPDNVFIQKGMVEGLISTTETIFHPYTLILTVTGILYSLGILYLLTPPRESVKEITDFISDPGAGSTGGDPDSGTGSPETLGERINHSRILGALIALGGLSIVFHRFGTQGLGALNLNIMNFGFLFAGLLLFTRPRVYQRRFYDAVSSTSGIILQFPFYAGIMSMMNESGLSETLAEGLISASSATTFPAVAWITGGIVNIFVPSGGGEWTVIGPSILEAAKNLGVPFGKATVAYAVGDAHTNLFQPFWALPLLGITGMRARDIFGYAIAMLLMLIPFLGVALVVVPYG